MKNRSFIWPGLLLALLLSLLTACGVGSSQKTNNSHLTTRPSSDELYVLDSYTGTGYNEVTHHIVALPTGATNPSARPS